MRVSNSMPGDGSRYTSVDLTVVRENTEDRYAGVESDSGSPEDNHIFPAVDKEFPA